MPTEALSDYKYVIEKTDPTKNLHERSQKRILEICKANCHMNCAKTMDVIYFPSLRSYQEVKSLWDTRKFLLTNNVNLEKI